MELSTSAPMIGRLQSSKGADTAGSGYNLELSPLGTDHDSSRKWSRRRLRKSKQQRRNVSSPEYQGVGVNFSTDLDQQLVCILRIVGLCNLQHFLIPATAQWNKRRGLGKGISFLVEEASLPVWRALSHTNYRHPRGIVDQKQLSYFTDHTGTRWDSNTRVAFKVPPNNEERLYDVIQELQILCHPPLRNHPNLVRLLGIAWVRQTSVDIAQPNEDEQQLVRRDQPIVVTEYASHGSLYDFLRSHIYTVQRVSLKTKLRLCMDLLEGLLALHACGIAHGDIKCENALVYDTNDSTAENWRAKLSDFGNAVVGLNTGANEPHDLAYSEPHSPPELPGGMGRILSGLVEKVDVWGWGMLLWYVMIDGKLLEDDRYWKCGGQFYREDLREDIDLEGLKETDGLSSVASTTCEAYLSYTHTPAEMALTRGISTILKSTLVKDPSERPSILDLIQKMAELHDSPGRMLTRATLGPAIQGGHALETMDGPEPLAKMPIFDFAQHHEIRDFPAVVTRIRNELDRATNLEQKDISPHAHLQLSLYYAGIDRFVNHELALKNIRKAASGGLERAQALMPRFYGALGVELPQESMNPFPSSSQRLAVSDSVTVTSDMLCLDHQASQTGAKVRSSSSDEPKLLQACRVGDLVAAEKLILQKREILVDGGSGESALHWLALLPSEHSQRLVAHLLEHEPELRHERATTRPVDVSEYPHFLRTIPAGTTALHWALESDNQPVFRKLLERLEHSYLLFNKVSLLCTAARCQSSECLVYFCQQLSLKEENVDGFDSLGYSALYYAICSDAIEQILRFVPSHGPTRHEQRYKTHKERHLIIVQSLLDNSSTMSVSVNGSFNIVHLAAALDTPDMLELVKQHRSLKQPEIQQEGMSSQALRSKRAEKGSPDEESGLLSNPDQREAPSLTDLVNEYDYMDMAPINAAIAHGGLENFKWLLQHGAKPHHVNARFTGHAIHLCSRHDEPIAFAEELLDMDPRCLNLQSVMGYTPLHHAAFYGHTALAEFLVNRGADLNAHSGGRATKKGNVTPLGAAISSRSLPMVEFICKKLKEQHLPLDAHVWRGVRKDALQYLLRPGMRFEASGHAYDGQSSPWDQGCYDHPFSKASKQILDHLLKKWPGPQRVRYWQGFAFTFVNFQMDPIHWAVRMANYDVIDELTKEEPYKGEHYKGDYRDLLAVAYRQLQIGSTHVARVEDILSMIEKLRAKQIDHYKKWLERHDPQESQNLLSRYYVTYLRKYVIMEQQQYQKALAWMSKHRLSSRPAMLEYRGAEQWLPDYRARFASIWLLLIPIIVSLIVAGLDHTAHYVVSNGIARVSMIILTNLNVLWPKLIRVATIFYDSTKAEYAAIDRRLIVLQLTLIVVGMAFSALNIWLVNFQNENLISYSFSTDQVMLYNQDVLPRTGTALNYLYNFTNCLIAYTVIAQMFFQIYTIIFLLNRWDMLGAGPNFNPHQKPKALPRSGRYGRYAPLTRSALMAGNFLRPFDTTPDDFYSKVPEQRLFSL